MADGAKQVLRSTGVSVNIECYKESPEIGIHNASGIM